MSGQMSDLSDQVYYNTNTVQIRPVQGIPSSNLGGQLTFVIDIAKDEMVLPQSIYLAGRLALESVSFVTADGTGVASKPLGLLQSLNTRSGVVGCISSGGLVNCFNKLQHEITGLSGSSVVQNIENLPQCQALLRQSFDSPIQSSENGTDIFNIVDPEKNLLLRGKDLTNFIQSPSICESPSSFILRNALKQRLNTNKEISLSSRLPIAMFQQETKLYQGQHRITLTVDPDYKRRLVDAVIIPNTATDAVIPTCTPFTGTYLDDLPAVLANDTKAIAVKLLDLFLYVEYVKISERPMGKQLLVFENFNVTQHPCSQSSDNFILPCKPNLLKLIMGFQRPTIRTLEANGQLRPAVLNPVGMMGFNQMALRLIRVRYLSDVYPQTDYNMMLQSGIHDGANVGDSYTNYVSTLTSDNFDTVRAYEDYYNACEFDESIQAMTYQQWLANPVFVFKFCSTSNISSNVEITLDSYSGTINTLEKATGNLTATNANLTSLADSTLYVLYVYRSIVEVEFTEDKADYKVFNVV